MISRPRIGLLVVALGATEVIGNATADISFNLWFASFHAGAASFTILLLSALFYVVLVTPMTLVYWWRKRHSIDPAFFSKGTGFSIGLIAAADLAIDVLGTYAAGHVPVLTQVIMKGAEPMVTWLLCCVVWPLERDTSKLIAIPLLAAVSALASVFLNLWSELNSPRTTEALPFWISVFVLRCFCSSFFNIAQGAFMRSKLRFFSEGNRLLLGMLALAGDFIISFCFILAFGALIDSIPGWGSSASYSAAWSNLAEGFRCVGGTPESCRNNAWLAVLTNGAWSGVYVADTFLNEASPALNSMLNLMSSPVAALALIIHPAWSLH